MRIIPVARPVAPGVGMPRHHDSSLSLQGAERTICGLSAGFDDILCTRVQRCLESNDIAVSHGRFNRSFRIIRTEQPIGHTGFTPQRQAVLCGDNIGAAQRGGGLTIQLELPNILVFRLGVIIFGVDGASDIVRDIAAGNLFRAASVRVQRNAAFVDGEGLVLVAGDGDHRLFRPAGKGGKGRRRAGGAGGVTLRQCRHPLDEAVRGVAGEAGERRVVLPGDRTIAFDDAVLPTIALAVQRNGIGGNRFFACCGGCGRHISTRACHGDSLTSHRAAVQPCAGHNAVDHCAVVRARGGIAAFGLPGNRFAVSVPLVGYIATLYAAGREVGQNSGQYSSHSHLAVAGTFSIVCAEGHAAAQITLPDNGKRLKRVSSRRNCIKGIAVGIAVLLIQQRNGAGAVGQFICPIAHRPEGQGAVAGAQGVAGSARAVVCCAFDSGGAVDGCLRLRRALAFCQGVFHHGLFCRNRQAHRLHAGLRVDGGISCYGQGAVVGGKTGNTVVPRGRRRQAAGRRAAAIIQRAVLNFLVAPASDPRSKIHRSIAD